ncbi:MAG: restriction endonuclease subunit S [Verrucomicrobiales bacterium]|nr:restriction endonuclease subunit S [Verrucomicrobiales bacterium]
MKGEWQRIRLGTVCKKIGSGATPRGGGEVYLANGPVALIRSQNVHNDGFRHDGLAYISHEHAAELQHVEVREGDVLLNITGDSVARCCQVDPSILPARVNQHVAIIRPDADKLNPRFLKYLLISPDTQSRLLSLAAAGATRPALTKRMIESLDVLVPPLPEQRAIAHILGTLDDKIELNRRMSQTLEQMARALFKAWFVDFEPVRAKMEGRWRRGQSLPGMPADTYDLWPARLVPSELGEIPEGWGVGSFSTIVELLRQQVKPQNGRNGCLTLQHPGVRRRAVPQIRTRCRD